MKTNTEISNQTVKDAEDGAMSFCADQDVVMASKEPTYQVWVFDYDKDHNFLGEYMDCEHPTKALAERAAIERAQISITSLEPGVFYREICVETVYFFEDLNDPEYSESGNFLTTMTIQIEREVEDEE